EDATRVFSWREGGDLFAPGMDVRRSQGGQDHRCLRRRHALRVLARGVGRERLLPFRRRSLSGAGIFGFRTGGRDESQQSDPCGGLRLRAPADRPEGTIRRTLSALLPGELLLTPEPTGALADDLRVRL